jgi:hypothetical protein
MGPAAAAILGALAGLSHSDRLGRRDVSLMAIAGIAAAACFGMSLASGPAVAEAAVLALLLGISANAWTCVFLALLADSGDLERAASRIRLSLTVSLRAPLVFPPGLAADRASYSAALLSVVALTMVGSLAVVVTKRIARRGSTAT